MSTRRFYRRRFLNKRGHHAGAYVIATVDVEHYTHKGKERRAVDAYIDLADCGRVIALDFDVNSKPRARNAIYKAQLLRDVLDGFIDALGDATGEAGHGN